MERKHCLVTAFAVFSLSGAAQITLEQTYPNTGYNQGEYGGQLFLWEFESSGHKYVKIDRDARVVTLYNLDHSFHTDFSFPNEPASSFPYVIYLSEHLFDLDDGIEYMFFAWNGIDTPFFRIYNDDGTVLLNMDECSIFVVASVHQQQFPIFQTPEGTKMIVSCQDQSARVYSLPGSWNGAMPVGENMMPSPQTNAMLFPDPATEQLTIQFGLSDGASVQTVQVLDASGRIALVHSVDTPADRTMLNLGTLQQGIYTVQFLTERGVLPAGRFVKVGPR